MKEVHLAARIALVQIAVVILGLVACFISIVVRFPPVSHWYPWAQVVRYGFVLLLLLPPVWMVVAMRKEQDAESRWSERWTLFTGLGLLVALAFLLGLTAINPGEQPIFSASASIANQ
ncbi:MAG: hypothetical protein JWO82_474 [Akkermansiaceae bacterium]|nr:hypothetical protein [Akkermansiaceae bacterium]